MKSCALKSTAIVSILDDDLYKFSMQNAVLRLYPDVRVKYRFTDRRAKGDWTGEALQALKGKIKNLRKLKLSAEERTWCEKNLKWFNRGYWDYLANYRFDPREVTVSVKDGKLNLEIEGLWCRTILWEVKLLALISETYYEYIDTNWSDDGQDEQMLAKSIQLTDEGVRWGDFGTRRRRNFAAQERVVRICKGNPNFTGTSNVHLAMKHGVKALGTM
ncbi:MAG: nicotinate phosphoribosyltransferase, partial [Candidatus Melainabacteria bacterium]|nr:nicotinate phosphoribosyltransferase [Candidatus Melainabacteria bacterium]